MNQIELTRRQFLFGLGVSAAALALTSCGGGGGSGVTTSPDNPANFMASMNGSVMENTAAKFDVGTRYDASLGDDKVIGIASGDTQFLSGEYLVFTVNGVQHVGDNDSAAKTMVKKGDHLSWKSLR